MMDFKNLLKKVIPTSIKKSEYLHNITIDKILEIECRKNPKAMLDYEVQLVEHCNLNCKSCSHFSPIAKEEFLDVDEYEKDCKRLSELFEQKVNFIRLMGGEPLLHPNIEKFLSITRNYFPNGIIDLDTNGILVLSMKDKFWKAMHDNNIYLTITKYPIKVNYDLIKQKCKEENVHFRFFDEQPVRIFNHLPLDLSGRQNIEKSFYNCYLANSCHTLKHGKMYTCSTIPHIEHFKKYYKCDLKVYEEDYIDIYKVKDKNEILNFLARPVPFCRYCNVEKRTLNGKWDVSKKSIKEWI